MPNPSLQMRISEVTKQQLEELCEQLGFSKSIIVAMAVKDLYEKQKGDRNADK